MQDADGSTLRRCSPAQPRPAPADPPFTPPNHYVFRDIKNQPSLPGHTRVPSLLLNQFSTFEPFSSPPPTYSSQPPPSSPPSVIDNGPDQPDSDISSNDAHSLLQDGSKDILIERLSHIIRHLQITTDSGDMVDALHSKVDEMYGVMGEFLGFDAGTGDANIFATLTHPTQWRTEHTKPRSTGWTMPMTGILQDADGEQPIPNPASAPPLLENDHRRPKDITPLLTAEINRLNTQLSTVLQSLRTRKEETDHIHALLLDRLSSAATHIVTLEDEIAELDQDLLTSTSDLRHLRLELRAVETLWRSSPAAAELTRSTAFSSPGSGASPRTPGATTTTTTAVDVELVQSIENWKADWRALRDKAAARERPRREKPGCGRQRRVKGDEEEESGVTTTTTPRRLKGGSVLGSPFRGVV